MYEERVFNMQDDLYLYQPWRGRGEVLGGTRSISFIDASDPWDGGRADSDHSVVRESLSSMKIKGFTCLDPMNQSCM